MSCKVALLAPLLLIAQMASMGALLSACKACNEDGAGETSAAEPPVNAPESLFGEGTLRDPDPFWTRVRSGAGGALMSMPDTAAGVVLKTARIDPRLGHLVDGAFPFQVALGEGESGGLAFAIAMKLRDLKAAQGALAAWDAGVAASAENEARGLTLIAPRGDGHSPARAALSSSGYLLVASSEADLFTLGLYAARTLPTKPKPSSSFELRAAPGALAQAGVKATNLGAWATSLLLSAARRAMPAPFDSAAFAACVNPTLRAQAAMVADLAEAKIDLDTGDGELHAAATLTPKPGDNAARTRLLAMHPGDAAPLLAVPGDATYAWFVSDTAAARSDDAKTIGPCLERATGAALGDEAKAIGEILSAFALGRGDWDTLSFVSTTGATGIVLRAPVADGDAGARSLGSLTDFARHPPASDFVQQVFGVQAGVVTNADVAGVGQATVLSFARTPEADGDARDKRDKNPTPRTRAALPPLGLAWAQSDAELDVSLGTSPAELLAYARAPRKLGDDLATAQAVRALGSDASFAAVLKPFGCCTNGGGTGTPLTFGWGRRGDGMWSRVEVGYGLVARVVGQ